MPSGAMGSGERLFIAGPICPRRTWFFINMGIMLAVEVFCMSVPQKKLVNICDTYRREEANTVENARRFFEAISNPYHFRVDDIAVNVQFAGPGATTLQSCLEKLLSGSRA